MIPTLLGGNGGQWPLTAVQEINMMIEIGGVLKDVFYFKSSIKLNSKTRKHEKAKTSLLYIMRGKSTFPSPDLCT